MQVVSLEQTTDNSIVVGISCTSQKNNGKIIDLIILQKLDAIGNLQWNTSIHSQEGAPLYLVGVSINQSINIWSHADDGECQSTESRNFTITNLDPETGNIIDARRYCFPSDTSVKSYSFIKHSYKIRKTATGYSLYGFTGERDSSRAYLLAFFSNDLTWLETHLISRPASLTPNSITNSTGKQHITLIVREANQSSRFLLSSLDQYQKHSRQRTVQSDGINLNVGIGDLGSILSSKENGAETLSISYLENDRPAIDFFQWHQNNPGTSYCLGIDTIAPSSWKPFPFIQSGYQWQEVEKNVFIAESLSITSKNVSFTSTDKCLEISKCDTITLIGPDTICDLTKRYNFLARRNAECSQRVTFISDTSQFSQFKQINDSIVEVQFKPNFKGYKQVRLFALLDGCVNQTDTIIIHLYNSRNLLGDQVTLCPRDTIRLSPGSWFKSYRWSDGSADSVYRAISPDTMRVEYITMCNEKYTDEVIIFNGSTGKKEMHSVCMGDTIELKSNAAISNEDWLPRYNILDDTRHIAKVFPERTTLYSVRYGNIYNCTTTDSFLVKVQPRADDFLPPIIKVCKEESVTLRSNMPFSSYQWNTGENTASISIENPGLYILTGIDSNNCRSVDSTTIIQYQCNQQLIFPTAFSPNNDGRNDIFKPIASGDLIYYRLFIYNRWGQMVFSTYDPESGWD